MNTWSSLDELKENLRLLRHYINGLELQNSLLAARIGNPATKHEQRLLECQKHFAQTNNKIQFDYNTIVVSLYGFFEYYIEQLISEYLAALSHTAPLFSDLPAEIQTKHVELSLQLIRNAGHTKYAARVRVDKVISHLHLCLSNAPEYELNADAFSQHDANFRQLVVSHTLSCCGISNLSQHLRGCSSLREYLLTEDPDRNVDKFLAAPDDIVLRRLDELADRRNDVAHGTPVDDLLSNQLLLGFVGFIEAYCEGLAQLTTDCLLPLMAKHKSLPLGRAIEIYNNRIVCIDLPGGRVQIGDTLIARTADPSRPYKAGPIIDIECDHVKMTAVDGGQDVQVAVVVDFGAKENQEFFLCNKPAQAGDPATALDASNAPLRLDRV